MNQHTQLKIYYLPPNFEMAEKLVVIFYLLKKSGFFYPEGRDFNFRPILVFNAKLNNFKEIESEIIASVNVHEEIIKKMFIRRKVESWIVIYDL